MQLFPSLKKHEYRPQGANKRKIISPAEKLEVAAKREVDEGFKRKGKRKYFLRWTFQGRPAAGTKALESRWLSMVSPSGVSSWTLWDSDKMTALQKRVMATHIYREAWEELTSRSLGQDIIGMNDKVVKGFTPKDSPATATLQNKIFRGAQPPEDLKNGVLLKPAFLGYPLTGPFFNF